MTYTEKILADRFDCFDEGCTECEVCKYFDFTDWAKAVGKPEGSTIERNIRIETYLRDKETSIHQAIAEDRENENTATVEAIKNLSRLTFQTHITDDIRTTASMLLTAHYDEQKSKYIRDLEFRIKKEHQAIAEERARVVEFIKGKSEKVTNDLWYVADQCLEDIPRFFSPLTDKNKDI